ncbi:44864_t:CDS:2, partial [Gigaspora margarita]
TNQLKNRLSYYNKTGQFEQRNGIEIEEQAAQPRRLIQKENFTDKDKNTRDSSQHNHYKRVQKPKENKAQLVKSVDLILSLQKNSRISLKTHRTDLYQDTISLSQISRKIKKCTDTIQITEWHKIFQKTNEYLLEINNCHKIKIQLLKVAEIAEIRLWLQDLKEEKEVTNLKEIESLLNYDSFNRPYNKIKIDRVLDQNKENLLTYPIEMKNKTQTFFQFQYKKRNTHLEELSDKWQEIHKLQGWIDKFIYKELNGTVSEEEWS